VAYLRISIIGVAPYLAFGVLRQTLQAMHLVRPVVWTILVANLTNAAFNWVFVYGHLGSPALGVAGSAIATAISRWIMLLLLLAVAWRHVRPALVPWLDSSMAPGPLWQMLRIGIPIGAQQALEAGAFGAVGLLMGVLGTVQMAAHQIAITLAAFTFMVPLGVGQAAAVRVGHAIGAGDDVRAKAAIRAAYICGVGFMSIAALAFLGAPRLLAHAFTPDERVVSLAAVLIPIAGVFQVFDGGQAVGRRCAARRGRHDRAARRHARGLLDRRRSGERVSRIQDVARAGRVVVGFRRLARRGGDLSLSTNQDPLPRQRSAIARGVARPPHRRRVRGARSLLRE
jgi:MATE family multidrug resistance protein